MLLIHIEADANGSTVTYYSCDECAQVLILEDFEHRD